MTKIIVVVVPVNDCGKRIGQHHPRAKYSDAQIDQVFYLRESKRWGYKKIHKATGVAIRTIRDILSGRCRNQIAFGFKKVERDERGDD